ncbi:uncharacterized protein N7479_003466 [Penicillium vulpinum]|uniref:Tyrosine specific protein phosphatases domain-containing protein n=1 Tax=Penicillium vulpinum TaxID=29845 RepID=A0A1V6RX64_9EURO|nr:uncharacterized protein N7479_003466 [Penicillium vulpinum]KAJ5963590.1 hypothetical protein N7479_003466 [Penicillium vulpinum]OQE06079.1 hypothetical protein PENVUL_c020G00173 [Penicillium vulpinum]
MSQDSTSTRSPPFVLLDGVPNFRDLGSYACYPSTAPSSLTKTADETRVGEWWIRPGFLFRSAQPTQITPPGTETLTKTLQIQTVFDFRSKGEIQLVTTRYPNSLLDIPGTRRHAVPVFQDGDYSPVSLAKRYGVTSDGPTEETDTERGFVKAYEDIARSAAQTGSFRTIMQHISQNPAGAVLFHCTVGKDRTGVFAALLLKLCGVADEDIVADYALTTLGLGTWREHLIQRLLQRGEASTREQAESIISSHPEDMRAFLTDVVAAKFGGVRKYFVDLCGLQEDELDRVVTTLVVPKEIKEGIKE